MRFNTDTMEVTPAVKTGGFQFSKTKLVNLGSSEYTLVTLVVDVSGSVSSFRDDLVKAIQEVVKSCQKSPRADNLMIRLVSFNADVTEQHGFKLLSECNLSDYQDAVKPYGMTALFDATINGIEATRQYGAELTAQDFDVNGIVFVITDGDDNQSTNTSKEVAKLIKQVQKEETSLESILTILIGVNTSDVDVDKFLTDFKTEAEFSQYEKIDNANANTLAKLAQFVSKSISAQSQSLGSGGASKPISLSI